MPAIRSHLPVPARKRLAVTQTLDPKLLAYLKRLGEIVDLEAIRKAGVKVAFDPMWGAARGYSDELLRGAGVEVATVHDYRDVLFGGHAPEPDDHLLEDLQGKKMVQRGLERRSALPPTATPTASASSTRMELSFSPTM